MPKPIGSKKTRQTHFRSSPKVAAILARLQYIGEHLFAGDIRAYASAVGLSTARMRRLLSGEGRFNTATLTRFVESGIAAAEWMFCGTGPMHARPDKLDSLAGYISTPIKSHYPIFDVLSAPPRKPKKVKKFITPKIDKHVVPYCLPLARHLFEARAAMNPVTLFIDESVIRSRVSNIVIELMRRGYITSVAMPFDAARLDYTMAKKDDYDPAVFQAAVFAASRAGVGFGEGVGMFGFTKEDDRARSILATGYDLGVPVTVHVTIGEDVTHAAPALYGAEYGAALGATSYVDMLVFIRHLHSHDPDKRSLFIVSGPNSVIAQRLLMTTVIAGTTGYAYANVDFRKLRRGWLADQEPDILFDVSAVAPYDKLFPAFLHACDFVYKGEPRDRSSKSGASKSG